MPGSAGAIGASAAAASGALGEAAGARAEPAAAGAALATATAALAYWRPMAGPGPMSKRSRKRAAEQLRRTGAAAEQPRQEVLEE